MTEPDGLQEDLGDGGGIRFCSDVVVRAPVPRPRPGADPATEVVPKGDAATAPCPLYVSEGALADVVRFAGSDRARELGGLLVGGRFIDERGEYAWVRSFLEGRHLQSLPLSARFTHATFEDAWRRIDEGVAGGREALVLGWFHTHPGFGAFLSGQDRFIHRNFFDLPFHVALVVDPVRKELLFFRWSGGEIRSSGFHLVREGKRMG